MNPIGPLINDKNYFNEQKKTSLLFRFQGKTILNKNTKEVIQSLKKSKLLVGESERAGSEATTITIKKTFSTIKGRKDLKISNYS